MSIYYWIFKNYFKYQRENLLSYFLQFFLKGSLMYMFPLRGRVFSKVQLLSCLFSELLGIQTVKCIHLTLPMIFPSPNIYMVTIISRFGYFSYLYLLNSAGFKSPKYIRNLP